MKSTLIVIPARYASTRLPGKPLIKLNDTPMIVSVYRAVSGAVHHGPGISIVVATDDCRISDILKDYKIPFVSTGEHRSGTDRVAEVARKLGYDSESLIINVQGDEPLIPSKFLKSFLNYCDQRGMEMATAATKITDERNLSDPNVVKVIIRQDGTALTFSRARIPYDRDGDNLAECYLCAHRHVGIYAYKNEILQKLVSSNECLLEKIEKLEQLRALWMGVPISVMISEEEVPSGVDTIDDVERINKILKGNINDRQRN